MLARTTLDRFADWDRLNPKQRLILVLETGAVVAILAGGLSEDEVCGGVAVSRDRVRELLELAGETA
jgi:hypothetical protein